MITLYSKKEYIMEYVIKYISTFFKNDKKERFDMILEPLQAIIQLALMSYCPIGSKLSIVNNILQIQIPTWSQGVTRSLNQDKKDDLFFLFSVINRFNKFYSYMRKRGGELSELYNILNELCKKGIDRIIQTYSRGENNVHLLHTLKMYRTMLENPDFFIEKSEEKDKVKEREKEKDKNEEREKGREKEKGKEREKVKERERERERERNEEIEERKSEIDSSNSNSVSNDTNASMNEIDSIFIKIRDIYKPEHYKIILNIFKLLEQSPNEFETYIQCLNNLYKPINSCIIKWINDNIIF